MIDVVFNSVDRSTFERIHAHQVFAKLKSMHKLLMREYRSRFKWQIEHQIHYAIHFAWWRIKKYTEKHVLNFYVFACTKAQ